MKKEFCQNVFLFPVSSQFLKLFPGRKHFFQLIKYFLNSTDIFDLSQPDFFGLIPVTSNLVLKIYVPLPAVYLAPI